MQPARYDEPAEKKQHLGDTVDCPYLKVIFPEYGRPPVFERA